MPQPREGKPKGINAVVTAHQAGMNVELLSDGSQREIVRVRKLIVYLSSSQVTSKTAKLPKAQRVIEITKKIYQQGCCWQIFFCFGGVRDHFCCAGFGQDRAGRAGSGCSPRLQAPLSRQRSGGCGLESGGIGQNRAAAPSPNRIFTCLWRSIQLDLLFSDFGSGPGGWPLKVWK